MPEDHVADLFDTVVDQLRPPVGGLIEAAEARGRVLRRRRHVRLAVGNTLAFAAVAGAGAAFAVYTSHGGAPQLNTAAAASSSSSARAASGVSSSSASPVPSPGTAQAVPAPSTEASTSGSQSPGTPSDSPTPSSTPSASGTPTALQPAQMLTDLKSLMPAGSKLSYVQTNHSDWLEVNYDDGQGLSDIMMIIGPVDGNTASCPTPLWSDEGPRPAGALPKSCAMRTLPDGTVERDVVFYADSEGLYSYSVLDIHPDGFTTTLQVSNGTIDPLPKVTRAVPPGSMQEWETVAESPLWTGASGSGSGS